MQNKGSGSSTGPAGGSGGGTAPPVQAGLNVRHFLRPPEPKERLSPAPGEELRKWRRWMTALVWHHPASSRRREREENAEVPAGYTYLLQFVAHDLVHMKGLPRRRDDVVAQARDTRTERLVLQTLYGPRPGDAAAGPPPLELPLLRLGPARGKGGRDVPDRDIPREVAAGGREGKALIADERNDMHSNISQLTALFMQLHNAIARNLPDDQGPASAFELARRATILLYREIVRKELMPMILDPRVEEIYRERVPILEPKPGQELPLEFAAGAFRYAHAMVRPHYDLVGPAGYLETIVRQTMRDRRTRMPLRADLLVRWGRFFPLEGLPAPNSSMCLVPTPPLYPSRGRVVPLEGDPDQRRGLQYRDLNTALLSGLWSPYALTEEITKLDKEIAERGKRDPRFGFLPKRDEVEPAIAEWLAEGGFFSGADDARNAIAKNPPLPFYVLFEAWSERGGAGRRLGPLGSTIVAETICGALAQDRPDFELGSLEQSLAALHPKLVPLAQCATMPSVVRLVAEVNNWQATSPAFL